MRLYPLVRSVGLLALMLSGASCASTPPPDTPVERAAEPRVGNAPGEAPARYEPVPQPEGILGTIRLGSPATDLAALREFVSPSPGSDFEALLLSDPSKLAGLFLGTLADYVDLSAPIDVVKFDEGGKSLSSFVISLTLRDSQETWQSPGFDFEAEADGRIMVRPKREAGQEAGLIGQKETSCGIFRGGAPVKSHLVCAADREKLDLAAPYLARTVALLPARPGLRVEVSEPKVRQIALEAQGRSRARGAESPVELEAMLLGEQVVMECLADIRDVAMDLQVGPAGVTAGIELRYRSLRSPFSLAMLGSAPSEVAPAFWRVPSDADLALYFPGAPPESIRAAAAPMWSRLAAAEIDGGAVRDAWREILANVSKVVLTGGPLVVAHGPAPDGASRSGSAQAPAQRYRGARAAAGGWFLFSSPDPLATWTSSARALLPVLPKASPPRPADRKEGPPSSMRREMIDYREVPVRPADGLPAGAIHIVRRVTPNPAYVPRVLYPALEGAYEHHLFIAGTAESTWLAVAEIEGLARAKLRDAMSGSSGGLSSRPELSRLRSLPAGGIGFLSLKALVPLLADTQTTVALKALDRSMQALGALRFDGETPIFVSLAPSGPAGDSTATLRISAEVSKDGAMDLIEWLR